MSQGRKGQLDPSLDMPLPVEQVAKLDVSYVTPNTSEATLNLQMDYIMNRKTVLSKWLFRAPVTLSITFGLISILLYHEFGSWISPYTFRDGFIEGMQRLLSNPMFRDDLIEMVCLLCLLIGIVWGCANYCTFFLATEAQEVPKNQEKYFGINLEKYSQLANKTKLADSEQKMVDFMESHSYGVVYRKTPIAFLVTQDITDNEKSIVRQITGYGIRRVYISAGVLEDLLTFLLRSMKKETGRRRKAIIEILSFESFDESVIKKVGFTLEKEEPTDESWALDSLYGVKKRTYAYEMSD